jgi:hypothetical protein
MKSFMVSFSPGLGTWLISSLEIRGLQRRGNFCSLSVALACRRFTDGFVLFPSRWLP